VKTQAWNSAAAQIAGVPPTALQSQSVTSSIVCPGLDLSQALIVWDVTGQQPGLGSTFAFSPYTLGANQVQVEAQLPDGRRVFAITNLFTLPTNTPPPLATNADMVALYRLSTDFSDATRRQPNLTPTQAAALDPIGLHLQGFGDHVLVNLPNPDVYDPANTQAISVEGRFYINSFSPEGLGASYPLALVQTLNTQLSLYQGTWVPAPDVYGGLLLLLPGTTLTNTFTVGQWHVLNVMLAKTNYTVTVDGLQILNTNSAGVLTNWLGSGTIQLQAGDFNGWLQNLVVRNVRPPRLSSLTRLPGDGAQLSFSGSAGISYTVRASANLLNWLPIGTATQTPSVGTFQFTDTQATNYSKRFYRVSIP
jgi:hypothetical protein